jgi:hypothetical protein
MRPDIRVDRVTDARIKDLADELGISWRECYREVIQLGLEELRANYQAGVSERDVREALDGWRFDGDTADQDQRELTADEIDAVVAMWRFIRDERVTSPKDIREHVHEGHEAGKKAGWWWQVLKWPLQDCPGVRKESQRKYVAVDRE